MSTRLRLLTGVLVAGVLGAVFLLYSQPDFVVQMANQLWSCF